MFKDKKPSGLKHPEIILWIHKHVHVAEITLQV